MKRGIKRVRIVRNSFLKDPTNNKGIYLKRSGKGSISKENQNLTPKQIEYIEEFDSFLKEIID